MIGDVEVRHHRMDRDGVGLHYVTAGHGPPLVLVHGFLGTWWAWRRVIPRLTEDYRVIAVDMRGYGDSDKPVRGEDPGFGYDSRNLAEDLRCVMRDAHVDAPARVVGHDMGAPACLTWAARYPAEVSHLAYLEEPTPGFTVEAITAYTANNGHPAWWFQFNAVPELPETLIRGREREFLSWFYDAFAANRAALDDGIEEYLRTFAAPGGISGALGWYRALRLSEQQTREDCAQLLAQPVLGLAGSASMGPQVLDGLRQVASDVDGGLLDGVGHFLAEEAPDALLAQLLPFLAGSPRPMN
jgi:pimeloyl-ACP methyl ester carboxylesterase